MSNLFQQALDFFKEKAPSHHVDLEKQKEYRQERDSFNKKTMKVFFSSIAVFGIGGMAGIFLYLNAFSLYLATPLLAVANLAALFAFGYLLSTDKKQAMLKARLVPPVNKEVADNVCLLLDQLLMLEKKNDPLRQQALDIKQTNLLEYEEKFLIAFNQKMEEARNDYLAKTSSSVLNQKEEVMIVKEDGFVSLDANPPMKTSISSLPPVRLER